MIITLYKLICHSRNLSTLCVNVNTKLVHKIILHIIFYEYILCNTFQPQYKFVYTALLEFITCGDTSIAGAETLKQKVTELSGIDHSVNKTGFQLQFEVTIKCITALVYPFINYFD